MDELRVRRWILGKRAQEKLLAIVIGRGTFKGARHPIRIPSSHTPRYCSPKKIFAPDAICAKDNGFSYLQTASVIANVPRTWTSRMYTKVKTQRRKFLFPFRFHVVVKKKLWNECNRTNPMESDEIECTQELRHKDTSSCFLFISML